MPTQEEAQQKGQQWLNSLGGAKEGGAARKGRGFKAPARAKPPPAMSPREPRRDGAEIAPSSREDLKDKGPATGEVLGTFTVSDASDVDRAVAAASGSDIVG